jgi:YjeF-related protein N-terminus
VKLFSAEQTRAWDAYTIQQEPISSLALMDRAADCFTDWFTRHYSDPQHPVHIAAGCGNNGGDGVAVAQRLSCIYSTTKPNHPPILLRSSRFCPSKGVCFLLGTASVIHCQASQARLYWWMPCLALAFPGPSKVHGLI